MRFRNLANWTNLNNLRGMLFFVQRIDELSFPYSLDSYKASTTSLGGLIDELMSLLSTASSQPKQISEKTLNSAEHVLTELRLRLKGNFIAKSIATVDVDRSAVFDREKETPQKAWERFKVLSADLNTESYIAKIVEEVIALSGSNQKDKLDLLAREFVATLQYRRVSREHINSSIVKFFFGGEPINDPVQLKEFCRMVYPHHHRFVVFLGVSGSILDVKQDVMDRRKITLLDIPECKEFISTIEDSVKRNAVLADFDKYCRNHEMENVILFQPEATDYNSAVLKTLSAIESIVSLFGMFAHKSQIIVAPSALVEQSCCDEERKLINTPQNSMHFIRDMINDRASIDMNRFDERISIDTGPDAMKFANVVNIHGTSLLQSSPELQLVNLWTCLETIAPGAEEASKISNVVNRVVPIIMLGYPARLVRATLNDTLRWNRWELNKQLIACKFDDGLDLLGRFSLLLTEDKYKPQLEALLYRTRDFELLKHRLYTLSKTLGTKKSLKEKMSKHEHFVRWQLHRIYRTRNNIVHAGSSPHYTRYLVENAHDYFDQVFRFCIELSAWKGGFNSFLSCFDYAAAQFGSYQARLNNKSDVEKFEPCWRIPRSAARSFIFADE